MRLPIRLLHGLTVAPVAPASEHATRTDCDALSDDALLEVLPFRLIWGVVGSSTGRFAQFPGVRV